VAFDTTPRAQYRVSYQPDLKHLRTIDEPQLFVTPYASPQLALWALGDDAWLKVVPPAHAACASSAFADRHTSNVRFRCALTSNSTGLVWYHIQEHHHGTPCVAPSIHPPTCDRRRY
jgi:hypothetical protein